MENMSKALIMAGAILIAMGVIFAGIIIANKGKDSLEEIGDITIDNAKRTAQVSKFIKYEGEVSGIELKQCILEAMAYNAALAKSGNYEDNLPYAISVEVKEPTLTYFVISKENYNVNGGIYELVYTSRINNISDFKKYKCTIEYENKLSTIRSLVFKE